MVTNEMFWTADVLDLTDWMRRRISPPLSEAIEPLGLRAAAPTRSMASCYAPAHTN
jgi:hypothetical protein